MSRKMLIKPFHSIESTATASHNWRRRQVLRAGVSTIALALVAPRLAHASSVLGVRVWPARDYTRVTIESDQPLQNAQQLLQGPDRLVVDLSGLDLDQELKDLVSKITPNDPQIQSVRIGQYQPHVVRMVFDLKGSVKPQVFTLTPIGSYKYRLVFDLYPAVAPDPLMELLAQIGAKAGSVRSVEPEPDAAARDAERPGHAAQIAHSACAAHARQHRRVLPEVRGQHRPAARARCPATDARAAAVGKAAGAARAAARQKERGRRRATTTPSPRRSRTTSRARRACSPSRSIRATAARTPARSAARARTRSTSRSTSRRSCARRSTPSRTCAR